MCAERCFQTQRLRRKRITAVPPKSPSPRPARTTPPAPCFNRRLVCVPCFHARFRQLRNRRPPRILSAPAADSMTPGLLSYSRTPAQRTLCRVPPMRVSFGSPPRPHPAYSPHAFLPHRLSASRATAPSCAAPFPKNVPFSRLVTTAGPIPASFSRPQMPSSLPDSAPSCAEPPIRAAVRLPPPGHPHAPAARTPRRSLIAIHFTSSCFY